MFDVPIMTLNVNNFRLCRQKIYILLYFFPLDEFEQEFNFCFIIIRKFGVQTFQKWQVSNHMNFVLSFCVSDRACDEFVREHKLENHFERNYFIRVRIESISKTFADAEKNSSSAFHLTSARHINALQTKFVFTSFVCYSCGWIWRWYGTPL